MTATTASPTTTVAPAPLASDSKRDKTETPASSVATTATKNGPIVVQTVEKFLARPFPPKDTLIEGLLNRGDAVAFAGRRRHGKTTFLAGLTTAGVLPLQQFLGYRIPKALRVLVFFLEDDPRDIQVKLRDLLGGRNTGERLAVYTREDFRREGIPIDVSEEPFRNRIYAICKQHAADIVIFDNLAHLIGADYNNARKIHLLMKFVHELTFGLNTAVIIAAHPRKRGGETDSMYGSSTDSLRCDSEAWFENVMGSSHFINSCGSLWGIERNIETNQTEFLGGTQRADGQEMLLTLEKGSDGWLRVLDDAAINFKLVMKNAMRKKSRELLPSGDFTYTEGERAVKPEMKSGSTFNGWFKQLTQLKLVLSGSKRDTYRKVAIPNPSATTGAGGK